MHSPASQSMRVIAVVLMVAAVCGAVGAGDELVLFPEGGGEVSYSVESAVLVNDAARRDRDLGYKLTARLTVDPVWRDHQQQSYLLKLLVSSVSVHGRGAAARSEWSPLGWEGWGGAGCEGYARWERGRVVSLHLPPALDVHAANYMRALASLFQFQTLNGEHHNETDMSGSCQVLYESLSSDVIRKIKRRCVWEGVESGEGGAGGEVGSARRIQCVELGPGLRGVRGASAEDVWVTGGAAGGGVKLRAWTRLQRVDGEGGAPPASPAPPAGGSLEEALPAHYVERALPLHPAAHTDTQRGAGAGRLSEAVSAARAALLGAEDAGGGGDARGAGALLDLLPALRAAPRRDLLRELQHPDNYPILTQLVRAVGLAGSAESHAAARAHLHLAQHDAARPLALHYLHALALAHSAEEGVVLDVLALAQEARHDDVTESALLTAAAAARSPRAARALRDHLARDLAKCKEDSCRVPRLHALGSLRRADTVEMLLQHACGGAGAAGGAAARGAALQALGAVAAAQPASLTVQQLERLRRVVLALDAPHALETRAAALDVLLETAAAQSSALHLTLLPLHLHEMAQELAAPRHPAELRRYMWQRLDALAPRHPAAAAHARLVRRDHPDLHHHYHPGTSSVLEREAGRGGGAGIAERWVARLDSAQLAAGGVLRAGAVRLDAIAPDNTTHRLLSIEIWARGLAALAGGGGGGGGEEEEEEEVAAGLAVGVGRARARGVPLFTGQGELLAAVWSGAGSEPTPALRATLDLGAHSDRAPTCAGVVATRSWRALLALALDAHATVSLWGRTARTGVALRLAGALHAETGVATPWGTLRAESRGAAEPRLHIDSDLDFYDKVALCVRTSIDPFLFSRNVTLQSELGAGAGGRHGRRAVRRVTRQSAAARGGGRTLALGADNDLACRHLSPAHPDM